MQQVKVSGELSVGSRNLYELAKQSRKEGLPLTFYQID
jgi:hypothetical protein